MCREAAEGGVRKAPLVVFEGKEEGGDPGTEPGNNHEAALPWNFLIAVLLCPPQSLSLYLTAALILRHVRLYALVEHHIEPQGILQKQ